MATTTGTTPEHGLTLAAAIASEEAKLFACVHCGFCLPVCPTYTRLGDEADSPRGRLYLMRAVVEGRLEPAAEAFETHLDRCLGCRACETVCPAGVEYGFLLERARAAILEAGRADWPARLLLATFGNAPLTRLVLAGGRVLRRIGLLAPMVRLLPRRLARLRFGLAMLAATRPWAGLRLAGAAAQGGSGAERPNPEPGKTPAPAVARSGSGPVGRATPPAGTASTRPDQDTVDAALVPGRPPAARVAAPVAPTPTAALPSPREALPAETRPVRSPGRQVALLDGCVQAGLFGHVNAATARVLRVNGCTVVPAPAQGCCGALHAHAGDLEGARRLARANINAFEAAGADAIAVNAAGCGSAMKEYGALLADDPAYAERARALAARVRDVSELLAQLEPVHGAPLRLRVTYDAPCHLHHAQRITAAPLEVLRRIPGLELLALPGADECCGGAGTYGLTHADLGGRILHDKVVAIRSTRAAVVVTPNPGCMMQIGAGLLLEGERTPVLHPLELVDESYRRAGFYDYADAEHATTDE